ncbi:MULTISPECIES: glycosyltransferase [unclassified Streptomyces]|uniref:glycosyltransferase n=1 Tax=Streptomyces TaxID=1883 RepID=UPI0001C18A9F|nr:MULTISPECIES: glycosyltransferase [unclassified Streptomyces]MYR66056.1 glycosyltransferase [Streptomyces sp. SID4939]MYS01010.1 glycosyltransferase [Streptomyces sp. SID4940]MYT65819.1 glycosyltransferase [Streptomyces sp. SID8357]MYT84145.1 glycosyltransferase [Streptomyces sp. SID8360]MYU36209.1 glycosyltransferase [Streptomyces sp. SID8358]MYW40401.1 glycosyltransferase [Streptomyces sp. SID1]
MKVLHIVTLHTPDHAFGGPTRVALNLSKVQRAHGDDARLMALGDGFEGALPGEVEGVPAHLFQARHLLPAFEVSGITSAALLRTARRMMRGADLVHVHLMRDLVTLPAALLALATRTPLVVQTHGMVDPTEKRVAQLTDLLGVRTVLRRADAVLHLTEQERLDVGAVAAPVALTNTVRLVNGVRTQERKPAREPGRPPVVLFLARIQERKRPEDFVAAMPAVLARHPDARFVLAGPDTGALPGTLALARKLGVMDALDHVGPLGHEEVLDAGRRADVYVLPSIEEPLGVSVLEAMSVGTPAVITRTCGLGPDVAAAGAGRVVDSRVGEDAANAAGIAGAVLELLEPGAGDRAGKAAWDLVNERFSVESVARTLGQTYEDVVRRRAR